ncbi:MAG: hypothetical protein AB1324_08355 [Candidatus Micrarchaeota archaeon]
MHRTIAIFALASVLLLAGCTGQQTQAPPSGGTPSGETPSGGAPSGGAPSGGTPSGGTPVDLAACTENCNVLVDSDMVVACKAGCHMEAAEEGRDASKCEPIKSLGLNATIYYAGCLWNYAEATGDASACSKLDVGFDRDLCLNNAAVAKKDPGICDQMNSTYMVESCKEDARGGPTG